MHDPSYNNYISHPPSPASRLSRSQHHLSSSQSDLSTAFTSQLIKVVILSSCHIFQRRRSKGREANQFNSKRNKVDLSFYFLSAHQRMLAQYQRNTRTSVRTKTIQQHQNRFHLCGILRCEATLLKSCIGCVDVY